MKFDNNNELELFLNLIDSIKVNNCPTCSDIKYCCNSLENAINFEEIKKKYNSSLANNTNKCENKVEFGNGRKPFKFSEVEVNKIKELKSQGYKNTEISRIMHCSEGTIRAYLKRYP